MNIDSIKESTKSNGEFEPFIKGYDQGYSDGKSKGRTKGLIIGSILGFFGACVLEVISKRNEIREEYKKEHPEEVGL